MTLKLGCLKAESLSFWAETMDAAATGMPVFVAFYSADHAASAMRTASAKKGLRGKPEEEENRRSDEYLLVIVESKCTTAAECDEVDRAMPPSAAVALSPPVHVACCAINLILGSSGVLSQAAAQWRRLQHSPAVFWFAAAISCVYPLARMWHQTEAIGRVHLIHHIDELHSSVLPPSAELRQMQSCVCLKAAATSCFEQDEGTNASVPH
jgi:hypothetical protein